MSTRENLTYGPGYIAVAPLGTTLPTDPADAAEIIAGTLAGWTTVGKTSTPVTVRVTPERKDVTSTQDGLPVAQLIPGSVAEITSTLLELPAARLADAIGGAVTTGDGITQIDPAGAPGQADYYAVAVVGPHTFGKTMLWVAEVAAVVSALELAYGRENETTNEFTWRVYAGTPAGLGSKGYRGRSFTTASTFTPAVVEGEGVETSTLDFTAVDAVFTVKVGAAATVTITFDSDLRDADALLDELTTALAGEDVTVAVSSGNVVTITATNNTDSIIIGGADPDAVGFTAGTYAPGA